ncbi:MAG TPA: PPOX class F420-dependent oxidoreductase [Ktedonobacterales bacterium]|jgi:PPOX class probable F420-dependent enzyme|nr:PPOX class F420-dependent oxidoreductase [Ktedonobacterales bacterium]
MTVSDRVRAFLEEPHYAMLATINGDGSVQQTVVWYELQGDEIMMNTAAGRLKEKNLRRDPRVSLGIEAAGDFVTITGTARLIDDQQTTQADIHRLAVRYDGAASAQRQMASFSKQQRVTIRLPIARVHAELDRG